MYIINIYQARPAVEIAPRLNHRQDPARGGRAMQDWERLYMDDPDAWCERQIEALNRHRESCRPTSTAREPCAGRIAEIVTWRRHRPPPQRRVAPRSQAPAAAPVRGSAHRSPPTARPTSPTASPTDAPTCSTRWSAIAGPRAAMAAKPRHELRADPDLFCTSRRPGRAARSARRHDLLRIAASLTPLRSFPAARRAAPRRG